MLRYSWLVIFVPQTRDSVLPLGSFFSSMFKCCGEVEFESFIIQLSDCTVPKYWKLSKTGLLLSGSEAIQTVNEQTNKIFQLMRRGREKIKLREMQW